jgi:hypothetical protein
MLATDWCKIAKPLVRSASGMVIRLPLDRVQSLAKTVSRRKGIVF